MSLLLKRWTRPGRLVAITSILVTASILLMAFYSIKSFQLVEDVKQLLSEVVGADVQFDDFDVMSLDGFHIEGVEFKSKKEPSLPPFLSIERIVVSYSPIRLLWGELKISSILIQTPIATVVGDPEGKNNLPEINETESIPTLQTGITDFNIILDSFRLENGKIISMLALPNHSSRGISLDSGKLEGKMEFTRKGLKAAGSLEVISIDFSPEIRFTQITSPFTLQDQSLKMTNALGKFFGGVAQGEIELNFAPQQPSYRMRMKCHDLSLPEIFKKFSADQSKMNGRLEADFQIDGSLSDPSLLQGTGTFTIREVSLAASEDFKTLASWLSLSPQMLAFPEIIAEYKITDQALTLYNLSGKNEFLEISAGGKFTFKKNLDLDVLLAIRTETLPEKARIFFSSREDGFSTITYKVKGTYDQHSNNLLDKLLPLDPASIPSPTPDVPAIPASSPADAPQPPRE